MAENEDDVALSRFFKVFLSETASESMAIPMSFNEHLEDPLPRKAKLQGTGGGVWTVSFTAIRDCAYFTSGWSKFAEDHELKDGVFLTFVYDGHPTFEVSVFGHSRCKETRAVVETVELSDSDDEEEEDSSVEADGEVEEVSQSIYPVDSNQTVSYEAGENVNSYCCRGFEHGGHSEIHALLPTSSRGHMSCLFQQMWLENMRLRLEIASSTLMQKGS
ncbi:hypothetical protein HID58_082119 [Brassica napus]|uniref:TF-B3 domain-containing protein n=1 Tax=Brassica napus TaxID=3708 RepID=A0ABQ7Y9M5_BRANA|nr:hypothetical protein HID58_082119 [Brassica napus]